MYDMERCYLACFLAQHEEDLQTDRVMIYECTHEYRCKFLFLAVTYRIHELCELWEVIPPARMNHLIVPQRVEMIG